MEIEGSLEGRKWGKVKDTQGGWKLTNKEILYLLMKEIEVEINAMDWCMYNLWMNPSKYHA